MRRLGRLAAFDCQERSLDIPHLGLRSLHRLATASSKTRSVITALTDQYIAVRSVPHGRSGGREGLLIFALPH